MVDDAACPDAPTLLGYVEGRIGGHIEGQLGSSERARLEVHLDGCPACLATVAELGRWTNAGEPELEGSTRYEVGAEVARGGMGRILQAFDRKLRRSVVLKTVADNRSAALERRLQREMAITARLQHPSIVPIYDAGHLETGEPYYAMRWIEGHTLRRLVDERTDTRARLTLLPIVLSLAEAIAYAHSQGIVHRDIKPSNVVVGPFGETMVLDWGLAKDLREPDDAELERIDARSEPEIRGAMTATGQIMGTPGYIAPEQARGQRVDERADVYAVGIILLELASGALASSGELAPLYLRAARHVPPDLAAIVRRATDADPARRYRDGSELAAELRRYAQGRLVLAHDYTLAQRVRRFVARRRAPVGLATAFVVALAVGGTWAIGRIVAERDAARAARTQAQEQQSRAEQRRDAAQRLVQFIVDDLQTSLVGIGRGDLLTKVADSVLTYFDGVTTDDGAADGTDLLQEAKTLEGLAGALFASSDIAGARRAYEGALRRAQAAGERGEAEATWWSLSARERLAYIDSVSGAPAQARDGLEAVVRDGRQEIARASVPSRWAQLVGPAMLSLYFLDQHEGHDAAAAARLDELERFANTIVGPPDAWRSVNADLWMAVLQNRAREAAAIGDWTAASTFRAERNGDPYTALMHMQLALVLTVPLAAADPTNTANGSLHGTTLQLMARNARERDALDEAARWFQRAEAVADDLCRRAPNDPEVWRRQSASSAKYLCQVNIERGAFAEAEAACARSLAALDHVAIVAPTLSLRRDVTGVSTLAARAALGLGRLEAAKRFVDRAEVWARETVAEDTSAPARLALAEALATRAEVAAREHDVAVLGEKAAQARVILAGEHAWPDPERVAGILDALQRIARRAG